VVNLPSARPSEFALVMLMICRVVNGGGRRKHSPSEKSRGKMAAERKALPSRLKWGGLTGADFWWAAASHQSSTKNAIEIG
jgi:hypothetical protein